MCDFMCDAKCDVIGREGMDWERRDWIGKGRKGLERDPRGRERETGLERKGKLDSEEALMVLYQ